MLLHTTTWDTAISTRGRLRATPSTCTLATVPTAHTTLPMATLAIHTATAV